MPLTYAALPKRTAALFFDSCILAPSAFAALWLPGALAVAWFAWFESAPRQASPGKRLLKLRVIEAAGRPVSGVQSLLRAALKCLPAVLAPYSIEAALALLSLTVITLALTTRHRGWYDFLCRTSVICVPPPQHSP